MKYRMDFVTNSSSSSFIVRAKEPIEEIKGNIIKITKENFYKAFMEAGDLEYEWLSYELSNEEIRDALGVSDEHIFFMILAKENKIDDYLKIKKALDNGDDLYFIDFEPYEDDIFYDIVEKNEVLMRGGL